MSLEELEGKFKAMSASFSETKEKLQDRNEEIEKLRTAIARLYLEIARMALINPQPLHEILEPRTPTPPPALQRYPQVPPLPPMKRQKYDH